NHHAQATRSVACRNDLRKANCGNGLKAAVSRLIEHMDNAGRKPAGYAAHRDKNTNWHKDSGPDRRGNSSRRLTHRATALAVAGSPGSFCGTSLTRLLLEY